MTYYLLDATALVYAYVPALPAIQELVKESARRDGERRAVVCDLSVIEATIALIERHEQWGVDKDQLAEAVDRLRSDFQSVTSPFIIVEVSGIVRGADDFLQIHDVSTPAVITLNAALALRHSLPAESDICIVSTDPRLLNAAGAENFRACYPYQIE